MMLVSFGPTRDTSRAAWRRAWRQARRPTMTDEEYSLVGWLLGDDPNRYLAIEAARVIRRGISGDTWTWYFTAAQTDRRCAATCLRGDPQRTRLIERAFRWLRIAKGSRGKA